MSSGATQCKGEGQALTASGLDGGRVQGLLDVQRLADVPEFVEQVEVGLDDAGAGDPFGVRVEVQSIPPSGLLQNHLIPRHYEAALYGLDTGYDPDAYAVWHSTQRGEDGLNIASYVSKTTDTILEQARQAQDRESRLRLYRDFQLTFLDELPSLPLYQPRYTYVLDRQVQGVSSGALFETSSRFVNVHEWFMKTKRVWKGQ